MKIVTLNGSWEFRQAGKDEWFQGQVPGSVHADLLAAGKIPDPFVGDNEGQVQWIGQVDWEYRRAFQVPADLLKEEHVTLVCDGLDTIAEVSVNGRPVGNAQNMFVTYRWEVKPLLKAGSNQIALAFRGPVTYEAEREAARRAQGLDPTLGDGPNIRKAPCHFGWDWGPKLPVIGIWKDIRLEGRSTARFDDVHLRQVHQAGTVRLSADMTLEKWAGADLSARLAITSPDGKKIHQEVKLDGDRGVVEAVIADAQLWWPNGYGAQPLYRVEISLLSGKEVIDAKTYRVGLRTIELRRKPDEWGESFTFVVNGVPVFAKGSDWIPADSFPTRITRQSLEGLIRSAVATHQNMLRVWGGGFFETEDFYDLCDEYGILVWQDFVFACSIYPLDEADFVANLHQEVIDNVRRLRHRASLALWCGNNEMEMGWEFWGWSKPEHARLKKADEAYFYHTLPEWVASLDPDRAYWPSSPSSNLPYQDTNGQSKGDAHYWDVWHGRKPFTAYRSQFPRFMSEFGFQSLPPFETVKTYAGAADWNMTSYIMEYHQRSGSGNGLMISQMTDTFRMPKDFESLVYLSMMLQAEGIRYGVEHWRRNMHRISGTLYWQLNDCWPVASWASLDYFGRWKALHYAARRFYAPVMLSILDEGLKMSVHVTSDLTAAWTGALTWHLVTLGGQVLESGEEAVIAAPLANTPVCSREFILTDAQRREVVFVAELRHGDETAGLNVATFAPNKHLALSDPQLKVDLYPEGDGLRLDVTAHSLARFVELGFEGADVVFSNNYFDVPGGWTVSVTCPLPAGWTVEQAQAALKMRSLYNSF